MFRSQCRRGLAYCIRSKEGCRKHRQIFGTLHLPSNFFGIDQLAESKSNPHASRFILPAASELAPASFLAAASSLPLHFSQPLPHSRFRSGCEEAAGRNEDGRSEAGVRVSSASSTRSGSASERQPLRTIPKSAAARLACGRCGFMTARAAGLSMAAPCICECSPRRCVEWRLAKKEDRQYDRSTN